MLWGRLSYDPTLPDAHFERTLARRFPEVNAAKLYAACARASKIIPRATTFSWGDIDVKWFPEGCTGHPNGRGFYTVEKFMHGESMPGSGVLSIADFLKGKPGMTPQQVADELKANAAAALDLVAGLRPVKNKELRLTLGDCEAMAHLGNYYAEKILGATDLALFARDGNGAQKDSSVAHLRAALEHWKRYAAVATAQYKPQLLTRIGWFDLNQLTAKVEQDVALAEGWMWGRIAHPTIIGRTGRYLAGSRLSVWNCDRRLGRGSVLSELAATPQRAIIAGSGRRPPP
jgi:hypothetical protein